MGYKWRPTKAQRREFAIKMNSDPEFREAYLERKRKRKEKRQSQSVFDYETAGGSYYVTKLQSEYAFEIKNKLQYTDKKYYINKLNEWLDDIMDDIIVRFDTGEKINHDYIHVLNTIVRANFDIDRAVNILNS